MLLRVKDMFFKCEQKKCVHKDRCKTVTSQRLNRTVKPSLYSKISPTGRIAVICETYQEEE